MAWSTAWPTSDDRFGGRSTLQEEARLEVVEPVDDNIRNDLSTEKAVCPDGALSGRWQAKRAKALLRSL